MGSGTTPLNPNGDAYISQSTAGFTTNDILQSEVAYKLIPPAIKEPTSDIQRGPNTLFTDLVQYVDGSGFYVFNDGTNLLFRLRVGSIVSGSKGYSILIDTDQKFGNTGTSPDPNYVASTTMNDGNPGFELEVTLETNFRVAVYNVDGTNSPTLITSYSLATNSQIGVALSTDSGTPDYFYDFYVPMSALPITATTPVRFTATTVMAPQSAIGGPKSDIFGVDDQAAGGSMAAWTSVINSEVPFTLNDLKSTGAGVSPARTAPSVVANNVIAGVNKTVTGTWTRFDAVKPSPAKIRLYKNGVLIDSVSDATTATWTFTVPSIAIGDVFYATAEATGESVSILSNKVIATGCSAAQTTSTSGLAFSCITRKGMKGTRVANTTVKIYTVSSTGNTLLADDNSTTYKVTYPTTTTWFYDGANGGGADPCTSSSNDIPDGSYAITATAVGYCESALVLTCQTSTATATPTITQTSLNVSSTTVSGTAVASSFVRLFKNGYQIATTTATSGGAYSFTGLTFTLGDQVQVYAQGASLCISAPAALVVACTTGTPYITTDNLGNLSTAATTITGTSYEPTGTTIRVLENGIQVATTTVGASNSWSVSYTPVATKVYTATAQNSSCGVSAASSSATALAATTSCPTISGTYGSSALAVTGTMPAAFSGTIRLYEDDVLIGSQTISSATGWSITVNSSYTNTLYPGGVLTVTAQATGAAEKTGCSSSVTVSCSAPPAPALASNNKTIQTGQSATFSVTNSQANILYSIANASTNANAGTSKFGTGAVLPISTLVYNSPGTYQVFIKGTNLSGTNCETLTSASILVNTSLPLKLLSFHAKLWNDQVQLTWTTEQEVNVDGFDIERSIDGRTYQPIGHVGASNSRVRNTYTYIDAEPGSASVVYYRLKMIDIDRKFEYSQIQKINRQQEGSINISPNPFSSTFVITVQHSRRESVNLLIRSVNSQVLFRKTFDVIAGTTVQTISEPSMRAGVYFAELVFADGHKEHLKIIKK